MASGAPLLVFPFWGGLARHYEGVVGVEHPVALTDEERVVSFHGVVYVFVVDDVILQTILIPCAHGVWIDPGPAAAIPTEGCLEVAEVSVRVDLGIRGRSTAWCVI